MPDQSIPTPMQSQPQSIPLEQPTIAVSGQQTGTLLEPRIVTMPKKFVTGATSSAKTGKGGPLPILIFVGIALLVVIVGGVGWWVWQSQQPASSVVSQPLAEESIQPAEQPEQPVVENTAPTQFALDAIVKDAGGNMLAAGKLILPQDLTGKETITFRGGPVLPVSLATPLDSVISTDGMYPVGGEFIIDPEVVLPSSATLSITLSPGVFATYSADSLSLAYWNVEQKKWSPIENSFLNKDQATMTVAVLQLYSTKYAIVATQQNVATKPVAPVVEQSKDQQNKPLTMAADDDEDLLTYLEEFLYGTDPMEADTDGDSYNDGIEVRNGYSPREPGSARLATDTKIAVYASSQFGFTALYPSAWVVAPLDEQTQREVIFTSATGEFIELRIEDAPTTDSLQKWFTSEGSSVSGYGEIKQIGSNEMSVSADGKVWYVKPMNGAHVFVLSYDIGTKTQLNFGTTFEMIARSLKMKE